MKVIKNILQLIFLDKCLDYCPRYITRGTEYSCNEINITCCKTYKNINLIHQIFNHIRNFLIKNW